MIQPCHMSKCENWDSDRNGGHCMLAIPKKHYCEYVGAYLCSEYTTKKNSETCERTEECKTRLKK